MVIDSQVLVGASLFGHTQVVETLLHRMDRLGIDRAVACPMKPRGYDFAVANDGVAQLVRRYPERFIGFARIDPWQEVAALGDLERAITDLGLRGLMLHPWEEVFAVNSHHVDRFLTCAADRDLPVLIEGGHPRVSEASQIADLAGRFPRVSLIITHGAQLNISGRGLFDAARLFDAHPNVILETSAVYRQDFLEQMARSIGPKRMVFGSGTPLFDQETELARVQHLNLAPDDKAHVLGGTMMNLLHIGSGAPSA